jgi:hypothetical protein
MEPEDKTNWTFTLEDGWRLPAHPLDDAEEIEDTRDDPPPDLTRPVINPFVVAS